MKRTGLLLIGLTIAILTNGQTIKIQGGTSISKLDWQLKGLSLYNKTLIGYSIFAGLDYLDKQYFNLSTNIGIIRKGGKDEIVLTDQFGELTRQINTEKPTLDYLSINTMIDLKYRIKETVSPFISLGPRFDYLVGRSKHFDSLEEIDELKSTSIGLILGGGLKYDISNLQFGLRADYYLDFTKVADWTIENTGNGGEVTVNTFTINFTLGYKP
ncbi:MAG: PorT family protein [Cyclobacteriaceae bacterium]|nr:PorT family protein [Cyclobacteriaceae bacterium]